MERQKQIDFLKSLCPKGKIEFNNLKETFVFDEINYLQNIYFLWCVNDNTKRNSDEDIIFKNYFCVDFDIRANFFKEKNQIIDDDMLDIYAEAIKQWLNKNWYWDRRYMVTSWNGFHVYYVGNWDEFTPEEYATAVEYYYSEIDKIFDDTIVKCDHAIKNIGRILRLPWSTNYNRVKKYKLEPKKVEIIEEQDVVSNKVDTIRYIYNIELEKEVKSYVNRQIRDITNPVLDMILDIDIIKLVQDKTWLELQPDKKNFKSPKDGSNVGMFVKNNILYRTGSHYISEKHKWYNSFTFVKEHYWLNNKETFEWFKDNYPELNSNKKKKKIEMTNEVEFDFDTKIPFSRWLPLLDRRFGKYDYNKFNIIIGESLSGKTERTFFQARENAKKHKVLYISLEMNPDDMIKRFCMKRAWVSQFDRSEKNISDSQKDIIKNTFKKVQKMENLKIIWMDSPTIDDIEWLIKEYYLSWYTLIYIDNLWFIVGDWKEIEYTAEISRRLKVMTNKYRLTINLIHHFRKWMTKERDTPRWLADIRSSGKLENDADSIINVRRNLSTDEEDEETKAEVNILLQKDRMFWQPSQQVIYFWKWDYIENNPFNRQGK